MLSAPFELKSYNFELNSTRIAQSPAANRVNSKLLNSVLGSLDDRFFHELPEIIKNMFPEGVLFVTNNTEVLRARLFGRKTSGGKIETLLFESSQNGLWKGFFKPGRRLHKGSRINFDENHFGVIEEKYSDGTMSMSWHGPSGLAEFMKIHGVLPLPPYIHNYDGDLQRYQTVYAKVPGASAAPTAGLHFNDQIIELLKSSGCDFAELTLHVGPGTFKVIETADIRDYEIHGEWINLSEECIAKIKQARQSKKPIICVGTTALRSLETVNRMNHLQEPWQGMTDIYIYPGQVVTSCDYLLTNFHLPHSSLLVLVAAFTGFDLYQKIYQHALNSDYRFFSFGDCMLLKNNSKLENYGN